MHALTLARQRLRARIQHPSTPEPVRLAHGLVENGQSRYLPILSSPLAQEILARGYEARILEKICANRASDVGIVGRMADRVILDLPLHSAFRERYEATVGEVCASVVLAVRAGAPEYRMLFAPCGLGCELLGAADRLRRTRPEAFARIRCWGVDPDADGHLLPEARRRTAAAGVPAEFLREDLRRFRSVDGVVELQGPFHLVNCVGASQTRTVEEMGALVEKYSRALTPGGTLLIDRWQPARTEVTADLGLKMQCHNARDFQLMLAAHGLTIEREHTTGEGGNVLIVARKNA